MLVKVISGELKVNDLNVWYLWRKIKLKINP